MRKIIFGLILLLSLSCLVTGCSPSIDKQLQTVAAKMTESCPVMLDEITRLESAEVLPDRQFVYNYTLIGVTAEDLEDEMLDGSEIFEAYKTHPDMKLFRDNGVKLLYKYKDEAGNDLYAISVTPTSLDIIR